MKKKIPAIILIILIILFKGSRIFPESTGSKKDKEKAVAAVADMIGDLDKEHMLKVVKEKDKGKMAEWFKGLCKSNKLLGETLSRCENIDKRIFIFQEVIPDHIPKDVWIKYFGNGKIRFGKVKEIVKVTTNRKIGLVPILEATGEKAGYALAAFSIAQDICNAMGSNDERRLKAIYTTSQNVLFNYLFQKAGLSLNPLITIGIDIIEWGLNTFIKQSLDRHRRDWEMAYIKYMDKHYSEEYWNKLIRDTFSESGGESQAKTQIQRALNRFWENPDVNFYDMMNKHSTFSSTRGGALAEKYKKNILAEYYNWEVKPKITVKLREEIMYARNEARYEAINTVKKLLKIFNNDELESIQNAIKMANDFKKAEVILDPVKITLKPGERRAFKATLKIGKLSLPLTDSDIKWSHKGGIFKAEKSMTGKTIAVTASISDKVGKAIIIVGDKSKNENESDLGAVRNIADHMKDLNSDTQNIIKDGNDLCNAGNASLDKVQQELVLDENNKMISPLDKYEEFHISQKKRIKVLETLKKKNTSDYISAGLNKKECEKKSMEACEGAYVLLSIRNSKNPSSFSTLDPGKAPGNILKAVTKFAALSREFGNKSLKDIKSVEETHKQAEEEYNLIKESVDKYTKEIYEAKKEQGGSSGIFSSIKNILGGGKKNSAGSSGNNLKKSGSELEKLESNIKYLEKTEEKLKKKYEEAKNLLLKHSENGNAQVILKNITEYYQDVNDSIKNLKKCRDELRAGFRSIEKDNPGRDKINYDSRENRDKIGRLHILVKQAYGHLTGIRENYKWVKGLVSAVEKAIKSAEKCLEKGQKFYNEIKDKQNAAENSGFSDGGSVTGHGGDSNSDKCDSVFREFDKFIRYNDTVYNEKNRKKALAILNKGRDCPHYKNWLSVLSMHGDKDENGFSDAGSVTGETSRTPPVSSGIKNKDDPLLGNWVSGVHKKKMNLIVKGIHKVAILNISKKNGTYFGTVKSYDQPLNRFIGDITQFGAFDSRLKVGQVVLKLKLQSGNIFSGQCVVSTTTVSPPNYIWAKCSAEVKKNGEIILTTPVPYHRDYKGRIVKAFSFFNKTRISRIYRIPGKISRTPPQSDKKLYSLLGNWKYSSFSRNPKQILKKSTTNLKNYTRIVKKGDSYIGFIGDVSGEWGYTYIRIPQEPFKHELKKGQVILRLKKVSANTYAGKSLFFYGTHPYPRRSLWTNCHIEIQEDGLFKFFIDYPPEYIEYRRKSNRSGKFNLGPSSRPEYYVRFGKPGNR